MLGWLLDKFFGREERRVLLLSIDYSKEDFGGYCLMEYEPKTGNYYIHQQGLCHPGMLIKLPAGIHPSEVQISRKGA